VRRSGALCLVFAAAAAIFLGCQGKKVPEATAASAEPGPAPVTGALSAERGRVRTVDGGGGGGTAPSCPPVDRARLAPFEVDRSAIKAAVPPIIDAKASLAPFYDKVLALARGHAAEHVRIGFYGDSNLTTDQLTGHMRRGLQARFGDAGHGFVALARPWAWYSHEDVHHHGTWPLFKQIACTTDPVPGHRYGFSHMAAESAKAGAAAWVATADEDAKVGRTASRFEVYFLKQPKGGSFDVMLDDKVVRTVSTAADDFEAGFELVEAPDAPHELRCVVKGDGMVRLFGTTLEREPAPPSIVIDSLGTGAMNFQRFMLTEPSIRKSQLAHRRYDLVVVWLGMNSMWLYPNRAWAHDTIATLRDALPGVPVLLVTPPDSVKLGERKTDPRILGLVKQLREVAEETGAAFWDFRAAMGGDAAYLEFMKRGLAANDRAHLSKHGNELMGQRLLSAMFADMGTRLETHPDAGCEAAPSATLR
jgi:GDSL-like Lipase/Acylhydrolase family